MLNRRLHRPWVPINRAFLILTAPKFFDLRKSSATGRLLILNQAAQHWYAGTAPRASGCAADRWDGRLLKRAVLLALDRYRPSDRGAPPPIDHTIGIPTNGMWPISWTSQRILIAGGRCMRTGTT